MFKMPPAAGLPIVDLIGTQGSVTVSRILREPRCAGTGLISCLFPSCSWLEKTIPAFKPYVGRDLRTRSPVRTISGPRALRWEGGTYHGRVAHDSHRCAAQCSCVNLVCNDCFGCGDDRIGLGPTFPLSRDGLHLHPHTSQGSQLLRQSLLTHRTWSDGLFSLSSVSHLSWILTSKGRSRMSLRGSSGH